MTDPIQQKSPPINRRRFLQITAAVGGLLLGGRLLDQSIRPPLSSLSETRTLMGTIVNLTVITRHREDGRSAIESTFAEMERLINCFDHRHESNALASLNRTGKLNTPPSELVEILSLATNYSKLTDGAFDVSVKPLVDVYQSDKSNNSALQHLVDYRQIQIAPDEISLGQAGMALTLDSIAKGQVVDGGTAVLRNLGFTNVLVEAGGDLVGMGTRADGSPWRVGITHPRRADNGDILSVLPVVSQALATSGDYMHAFSQDLSHHHIIDPRTGVSPVDLASVSVLAPSAADADALSTAVMVMGRQDGLALIESLPHVEAMAVTKSMMVHHSTGFPAGTLGDDTI